MSFLSFFCHAFVCVCLLMPCGHLLGKGWPLGSRLWCLIFDCIDSWSVPFFLTLMRCPYAQNAIFAPCDILAPHISYNNYLGSNLDTIRLLFLLNVPYCLIILIRYRPSLLQEYHCYWFSLLFGHTLPERVKYKLWLLNPSIFAPVVCLFFWILQNSYFRRKVKLI